MMRRGICYSASGAQPLSPVQLFSKVQHYVPVNKYETWECLSSPGLTSLHKRFSEREFLAAKTFTLMN